MTKRVEQHLTLTFSPKRMRFLLIGFLSVAFALSSSQGLCPSPQQRGSSFSRHNHTKRVWIEGVGRKSATYLPRGGVLQHTHLILENESSVTEQDESSRKGMAAALFSTYFAVMGAKCALPSVLPLLISPTVGLTFPIGSSTPNELMARTIALSTIAIAVGKALSGPIIDKFGGILSLRVSLTTLMAALGVIAWSQNFAVFAISWVLVDFIFSSCWASCVNAVHQSFPADEWAQRISLLAAAARTGNAVAFATFAAVLRLTNGATQQTKQPWRIVFWVSAAMQLLPISLLTFYGRFPRSQSVDEPNNGLGTQQERQHQKTKQSPLIALRREAGTPEFWFHFLSRSSLMVLVSFLLFIPSLFTNCYGMSMSSATNVGSVFALGSLLSVTTGSKCYSRFTRRGKISAIVSMMGMATLCCLAQLAHMMGIVALTPSVSAGLIFLFGFSCAIPFYIPPSLYALDRGGSESSATIADVFDFGGFSLLAIFNGYVASIRHDIRSAWIPTFAILTGCAITSLFSLSFAVFFEERRKKMNS